MTARGLRSTAATSTSGATSTPGSATDDARAVVSVLVPWDRYEPRDQLYMEFDTPHVRMLSKMNADKCDFWDTMRRDPLSLGYDF